MTEYSGIMAEDINRNIKAADAAFHIAPKFPSLRNSGISFEGACMRSDSEIDTGDTIANIPVLSPATAGAVRPHSFGDDQLFWRVWYSPVTAELPLITEDTEYAIKIWNAYLDQVVNITNVATTTIDGIEFTPPATPFYIQKFAEYSITFVVERDGNPVQNSTITFTVDGVDYTTTISGIRIIPFVYDIDYKNLSYDVAFETVISANRFFVEQRRALRDEMIYSANITAHGSGVDKQKLQNKVKYGKDAVWGVPVCFEPLYPSSVITGSTIINVSNDISQHWYLNNQADYALLINPVTLTGEIKEISSLTSSSITFARAVVESFEDNNTLIFPVILCLLKTVKMKSVTDGLAVVNFDFGAYING